MSRYEKLQDCLRTSRDIFNQESEHCFLSAELIRDAISEYLGKQAACHYFHWHTDDASIRKPLSEAHYWANHEIPTMVVGLGISVEVDDAFTHVGLKLCLNPTESGTTVAIEEHQVVIVRAGDKLRFADATELDQFLTFVFEELENTVTTPAHHPPPNAKSRIGFHSRSDEGE